MNFLKADSGNKHKDNLNNI